MWSLEQLVRGSFLYIYKFERTTSLLIGRTGHIVSHLYKRLAPDTTAIPAYSQIWLKQCYSL